MKRLTILLIFFSFLNFNAWAAPSNYSESILSSGITPKSMDLYYTGIKNFQMTEVGLDLNLNRRKDMTANLYWTNINASEDSKSVSNQILASVEKSYESDSLRAGINYWNDPTSHINYTGPGLYWSHDLSLDSSNDSQFELGADALVYQTKTVLEEETQKNQFNQYHPNIKFTQGFLNNRAVLTSTYAYYIYNTDIEKIVNDGLEANQVFESTLYTSAGKFINGFLRHEYNLNFNFEINEQSSLIFDAGQAQSAVDLEWSTSFGPTLSHKISKDLLMEICFNRTVMYGTNYSYYTAGMNYRF